MSILRVTLVGTSAAQPTLRRGLSATSVRAHRDHFLVDCGEGTQRQLLRYGTGFDVDFVLFTHFHADHYLGIIGFLRTMAMGGRTKPLALYGPRPFGDEDRLAVQLELDREDMPFHVFFRRLSGGERIDRDGYAVRAVPVEHRVPALGYVLEEPPRPGVFDLARARELGVPEGPLYGLLQRGQPVALPDGRQILPHDVVGPGRRGRKVVFSGDTRPCPALIEAAAGADLLIHDGTFATAEQARAIETGHSTVAEAAEVAARAGVHELVLTHVSSRYSETEPLCAEARAVWDGPITVADDGFEREIPLPL
jgi:ribonuclease Z